MLARSGVDPERILLSRAALLIAAPDCGSRDAGVPGWYGLVDGVPRLDLDSNNDGEPFHRADRRKS